MLVPPTSQRGFPIDKQHEATFTSVVDAKVGLAQGMILGDPDCSAVTRIANRPNVHGVSEVLKSGFVVDPKNTWTITNSQNTAFVREFAPAFFMLPSVGRMDDIYASLIMQRVMRDRGYVTHFGRPFAYQQRNSHDLVKDLCGEIDGMRNVTLLADYLSESDFRGMEVDFNNPLAWGTGSVISQLRMMWTDLGHSAWMPKLTVEAALAFLDDCEAVL
jgi:hypothetical protein